MSGKGCSGIPLIPVMIGVHGIGRVDGFMMLHPAQEIGGQVELGVVEQQKRVFPCKLMYGLAIGENGCLCISKSIGMYKSK